MSWWERQRPGGNDADASTEVVDFAHDMLDRLESELAAIQAFELHQLANSGDPKQIHEAARPLRVRATDARKGR